MLNKVPPQGRPRDHKIRLLAPPVRPGYRKICGLPPPGAPDIAKYKIKCLDLKPAKFNNFGSNGEESSIVTSTGDILVTWNFMKVKKGILNQY